MIDEEFAVEGATGGRVTVLPGFRHPERGAVRCPAAPLLAAWLRRRGVDAVVGTVGIVGGALEAPAAASGVVAATFFDGSVGMGLAAAADGEQLPHARAAVAAWSSVLRTRRILLPAPVASCTVADRYASPMPRPRSATPHSHDCLRVGQAFQSLRRFAERGDTVLLIGAGPLLSLPASAHRARVVAVNSLDTARSVRIADPAGISFVLRPCTLIEEAVEILAVLRSRFPMLRGQHPDEWCYSAEDDRAAARSVAGRSDVTLLLPGGGEPPAAARRTVRLASLADLYPGHLRDVATVAVIGGDESGHDGLTREMAVQVINGLGPVSAVEFQATSRILPQRAARAVRQR
ncbi:hypothetical protein [Kitasatospora sp. SolWspMP-SS2h]|uniref:hypothetical protein n=1 Tax=Kitasatospora sp. SolWspMP-SS2h TaxID=1305729 RepID=UPI000DB960F9|nr:hypothetical protein [Kitasatospora sp. SolWspMP-SS2h]